MPELLKLLHGPAVSYGKGAIGVAGEMEHGGACVHPMLCKSMRAAVGGGFGKLGFCGLKIGLGVFKSAVDLANAYPIAILILVDSPLMRKGMVRVGADCLFGRVKNNCKDPKLTLGWCGAGLCDCGVTTLTLQPMTKITDTGPTSVGIEPLVAKLNPIVKGRAF
jgi:hypothetical protein